MYIIYYLILWIFISRVFFLLNRDNMYVLIYQFSFCLYCFVSTKMMTINLFYLSLLSIKIIFVMLTLINVYRNTAFCVLFSSTFLWWWKKKWNTWCRAYQIINNLYYRRKLEYQKYSEIFRPKYDVQKAKVKTILISLSSIHLCVIQ